MINKINFNQPIYRQNGLKNNCAKANITFCARPEFEKLPSYVLTSHFFRREKGIFKDVENAIKLVLSQESKPKILIVGVGKAQEPFSYLAAAKEHLGNKPLEHHFDLNCVDLQPKISNENLEKYSYYNMVGSPAYAPSSFTQDKIGRYKVNFEITNYIKNIFNNPAKTKWDTKIEDYADLGKAKSYNLISINLVLMYIKDEETKAKVMQNLTKMLKPNGILITDIIYQNKVLDSNFPFLKVIAHGIFQRTR